MEASGFFPILQNQKPAQENYLKIIPPPLPIYYFMQSQSDQHAIIVINHPKNPMKIATLMTRQDHEKFQEEEMTPIKEDEYEELAILPDKREINILSILIIESIFIFLCGVGRGGLLLPLSIIHLYSLNSINETRPHYM